MLNQSRPNLLFGAYYERGITPEKAKQAEYTVATTRQQMLDMIEPVDTNSTEVFYLAGLFCPDEMPWEYDYYYPKPFLPAQQEQSKAITYETAPHLSEMTSAALKVLDNDPDGFFLMIEGGKIDWAGHDNILEQNIFETLEFDRAFKRVMYWAKDRDDTIIIVTADHECGGLKVIKGYGRGIMPEVFWGTEAHTGVNVPIYAFGQGAEEFAGVIDNTDIYKICMKLTSESPVEAPEPQGQN